MQCQFALPGNPETAAGLTPYEWHATPFTHGVEAPLPATWETDGHDPSWARSPTSAGSGQSRIAARAPVP